METRNLPTRGITPPHYKTTPNPPEDFRVSLKLFTEREGEEKKYGDKSDDDLRFVGGFSGYCEYRKGGRKISTNTIQ